MLGADGADEGVEEDGVAAGTVNLDDVVEDDASVTTGVMAKRLKATKEELTYHKLFILSRLPEKLHKYDPPDHRDMTTR